MSYNGSILNTPSAGNIDMTISPFETSPGSSFSPDTSVCLPPTCFQEDVYEEDGSKHTITRIIGARILETNELMIQKSEEQRSKSEKILKIFLKTIGIAAIMTAGVAVVTLTPVVPFLYSGAVTVTLLAASKISMVISSIGAINFAAYVPTLSTTTIVSSISATSVVLCGYGIHKGYHSYLARQEEKWIARYKACVTDTQSLVRDFVERFTKVGRVTLSVREFSDFSQRISKLKENWERIQGPEVTEKITQEITYNLQKLELAALLLEAIYYIDELDMRGAALAKEKIREYQENSPKNSNNQNNAFFYKINLCKDFNEVIQLVFDSQ